ncbi:MAG: CBS domain-containing protein [Candidatus Aenigmatarchaeota archaeon]
MVKTTEIIVENFMESLPTITKDTEINEVINIMKRERTTSLPVVDKDGKLIGCIFDYNLIKLVRKGSPIAGFIWRNSIDKEDKNIKAEEIMDTKIVTISNTDTIETALNVMSNSNARLLMVTDREGKFLGVLRIRTIFSKIFEEIEEETK